MTDVSLEIYRGKKTGWFTGDPMTTSGDEPVSMSPIQLPGLGESLLTDYTVKIGKRVAAVYDKGVFVAGHYWEPHGTMLYVSPKYRGKGIATALVLFCALRDPGPRTAITRSRGGQEVYLRVWELIQAKLAEGK